MSASFLFLDIDGVCNTDSQDALSYSNMKKVCKWLKENPQTKVVVTSTWRLLAGFDKALGFAFKKAGLPDVIVGCTPQFGHLVQLDCASRGLFVGSSPTI